MRGADKLLEPVDGMALLTRQARAALATGARVIVTLPPAPGPRGAALARLDVTRVPVADAAEGMAASIRAGVAALSPGTSALMILLADLPEIEAPDLARLLAAQSETPGAILRAAAEDGRPGHPVVFPPDLFAELAMVTGDEGARRVVAAHRGRLRDLPLPGARAVTDLDTPEAWAAWRAMTGR